ncbi:MAG TPA: peptidoglycan-binding protein [Candidatus Paceibacterota bacterium]|nr:peptidoglycan-binding protein [Candidatus Paceibacterota bacterium]
MTQALARSRTVVAALGFGLLAAVLFGFSALSAEAQTAPFTTQMQVGSRGSQVTLLQQSLASNPNFYPQGLVTGYFGALTRNAVIRFQQFYGISPVGRVGPQTLAKLNQIYGTVSTGDINAPLFLSANVSMSSTTAVVSWTTNEAATGRVYFSTSPLVYTEALVGAPTVSGNSVATDSISRTSQSVSLSGLSANTTYNFMVVVTDPSGNVSVTWPSTFRTNAQ